MAAAALKFVPNITACRRFVVPCAAMETPRTDEELMLAYARGDALAFDRLYQRVRGMLYRFILRSIRERAVADELTAHSSPAACGRAAASGSVVARPPLLPCGLRPESP